MWHTKDQGYAYLEASPSQLHLKPPTVDIGEAASSPVRDALALPECPISPVEAGAFARSFTPSLTTLPRQPVLLSPQKRVKFFKYLEDNIICVNHDSRSAKIKVKQSIPSQNAFHSVTGNAEKPLACW